MPGMYSGSGTCLACHASCKTCDGSKVSNIFGTYIFCHIFLDHISLLPWRRETARPATLSIGSTYLPVSQPALRDLDPQRRSSLDFLSSSDWTKTYYQTYLIQSWHSKTCFIADSHLPGLSSCLQLLWRGGQVRNPIFKVILSLEWSYVPSE